MKQVNATLEQCYELLKQLSDDYVIELRPHDSTPFCLVNTMSDTVVRSSSIDALRDTLSKVLGYEKLLWQPY
jgi:hypothetical protein